MRLPFRKAPESDEVEPPSFGPWALRHCAGGVATATMPAVALVQVCADTAAIIIGAAYAYSDLLLAMFEPNTTSLEEGRLLAHRTQAGFEKIAAAPTPAGAPAARPTTDLGAGSSAPAPPTEATPAGVWPWDHLAAAIVAQVGEGTLAASEECLGTAILETATVYVLSHREQLTSVLDLWYRTVEQLPSTVAAGKQDLVRTGAYLLEQFHEELGLADTFAEVKAGRALPLVG